MQFDKNKIYSTLQKRSEDDQGNYFIDSQQEVLDFDEITQEVADQYRNKKPVASCDALYVKDDSHIYLIELKNARRSRIGKNFFKQKAYASVWTLMAAFYQDLSLEELKERLYLVVVFNDEEIIEKEQESQYFQAFKKKVGQLAGEKESILFGMDIYKGTFYKDVYTVEKNVFLKQMYQDIFE
ncbi:MAG: hypothetical protein HFI70_11405 [Lachnospiraceae bacterium]|nr:hypothetical protein [Lachnospiraceae bacterium]